ncbi:ribonuclease III [Desulfobotulus sp.]|jgi:ribonuclease III|uniref:ribonuclease III n=1 Tax=Desulfobotulus sp. TaxID=1940337 RepID=UPI002A35AFA3|nr:ribonuclease III [Desulfobotulus sp.]MDY0162127.1 ribonuclease III [Desulfobotulus sp.]
MKKFPAAMADLERVMGYGFRNPDLLETALCHASFVNEHALALKDNERLEFLGDAVLNLVIGHLLMDRFRQVREGDLSRIRASLVNERQLASVARALNLGQHLRLGRGEEQTRGRDKDSILADAFEALVAAVYRDGGFDPAFTFVKRCFGGIIEALDVAESIHDAKSRLQEEVQMRHRATPVYRVVGEEGPDHDKVFHVEVRVQNLCAQGAGKSKKLAEQDAARKALRLLEKKNG